MIKNENKLNIGFSSYYKVYNKNNSFLNPKYYAIGDNLEYPFVLLKEKLLEQNATLNTLDLLPLNKFEKVIFTDFPSNNLNLLKDLYNNNVDLYLIIFESELIRPENWLKENHRYFSKVFTWNDDWVDGKKYVKYYWPNKIPTQVSVNISGKEKFCTMIAGNKMKFGDNRELYSKRIEAIRWFERNQPDKFDLYGMGWEEGIFKPQFHFILKFKLLNKTVRITEKFFHFKKGTKPLKEYFASYKGKVESKKDIYSRYKFAICYENAKDIPGYITEKIFDCFFAGCVPVYLGAPNITDYIPSNCFIDKRKFTTYDELYHYLTNITEEEYTAYLNSIKNFLKSDKAFRFSAEYFVKILVDNII